MQSWGQVEQNREANADVVVKECSLLEISFTTLLSLHHSLYIHIGSFNDTELITSGPAAN